MNQVHKVIWSRVKNCYIVVSEITKRVGRDNKASVTEIRPLRALLCAMVIAGCMLPADADAASGIVWGTGASAPGQDSVAVGTNAKAKKSHAVAQGTEAKADGVYALAFGYKVQTLANYAIAMGHQAKAGANAIGGVAIGSSSVVEGEHGVALGDQAESKNKQTIAVGLKSVSSGEQSISIGHQAKAIGNNSIAEGAGAKGYAKDGVAIGNNAESGTADNKDPRIPTIPSNNGVAVGNSAKASGGSSVSVGNDSIGNGPSSVAIGNAATANDVRTTAIGNNAHAEGAGSLSIGREASALTLENATSTNPLVTGTDEQLDRKGVMAIGDDAKASGNNSIALGTSAKAGDLEKTRNADSVTLTGSAKRITKLTTKRSVNNAVAIGTESSVQSDEDIAVGYRATTVASKYHQLPGSGQVAIGSNSNTYGSRGDVAIGSGAETNIRVKNVDHTNGPTEKRDAQSVAIGSVAKAYGSQAVAVGADTRAIGNSSVAIGTDDIELDRAKLQSLLPGLANNENLNNKAPSDATLGSAALHDKPYYVKTASIGTASVALGAMSQAAGDASMAMGLNALAEGDASTAIGPLARSKGKKSIAMGVNANSQVDGGVALGADSVSNRQQTSNAYIPSGADTAQVNAINATKGTTGAVSVGSDTVKRQIINVAAGTDDSDAVNVAQLKAVTSNASWTVQGNGSDVNAVKNGSKVNFADGTNTTASVTKDASGKVTAVKYNLKKDVNLGTDGSLTINGNTYINKDGINAGNKQITNVASGGDVVTNAANIGDINRIVTAKDKYITKGKATYQTNGDGTATLTGTNGLSANVTGLKNNYVTSGSVSNDGKTLTLERNDTGKVNVDLSKIFTEVAKEDYHLVANPEAGSQGKYKADSSGNMVLTVANEKGEKKQVTLTDIASKAQQNTNTTNITNINKTIEKGLNFGGDSGADINKKLGEKLEIKGGASADLTDGNIGVVSDGTKLNVKLKKDVDLGPNGSLTINGKTYVNKDGLNANSQKITNVADGTANSDAVNLGQLNAAIGGTAKATTVKAKDANVTVTEGTNPAGGKEYTVGLGDKVTLGTADKKIVVDGTSGKITAGSKVTIDGTTGDIQAGTVKVTGAGTVNELTNRTWDIDNPTVVHGQAATEDQLKTVSDGVKTNKTNITNINNTIGKGLNFGGDSGAVINKKLGEKLEIKGGASADLTDDNIGVVSDGTKLNVKLKKDVNLGPDGSLTINGKTYVNKDGLNANSQKITNVADGTVNSDAVNFGQLKDAVAAGKTILKDGKNTTVEGEGTVANPYKVNVNDDLVLGKKGADGKDGSIGVNGKDGSSVVIHGKDGISIKGKDGKDGVTLKAKDGANGTEGQIGLTGPAGKDGKSTHADIGVNAGPASLDPAKNLSATEMTRLYYVDEKGDHQVATMDDGMKFAGNTGLAIKKLNSTMTIRGTGTKADTEYDPSNIKTMVDADGNMIVGLDKNLKADSVGINGKDGRDGATIKGGDGKPGVDGTNITRLIIEEKNGKQHDIATLDDGMKYGGDTGAVIKKKLNEQVNVVGGITDESKLTTDDNIGVVSDGSNNLKVRLAKDVKLNSVTAGNVVMDTTGFYVKKMTRTPAGTVSLTADGLNNGGNKIANIAAGEADTDAVNVSQLKNQGSEIVNKGFGIKAEDGNEVKKKLGETVDVVGDGKNISTRVEGGRVRVGLKDDILLNSVTTGRTRMDTNGLTVQDGSGNTAVTVDKDGLKIKDGPSVTKSGIDAGGKKITNVAAGEADTDAVNVSQLKKAAAGATTKVADGKNTTVTSETNADGSKTYHVNLNDDITLGTDPSKQISIKGTEGTIKAGQVTVNGTAGTVNGLTNKTWDPNNITSGQAATEDQLKVVSGQAGKHSSVTAGSNISVTTGTNANGGTEYKVAVVDTPTFKTVTTGNTVMSNSGLTIKNGPSITQTGVDAGGKRITNVAAGKADTDAVNVGQLKQIGGAINKVDNRINRVGAGAAALAALHPLDFDPDDKWDFTLGYGNYKDAHSLALGAFYRPNEDTMISVGGSIGGGENMVNAGLSMKLGQGNHVSTSKVAMAKEIKDLRAELENVKGALLKVADGRPLDSMDMDKMQLFPDVPENHWAYDYVATLAGNGVIVGYPDGQFGGDRMMTRYEMAALIYRAMQNGAAADDRMARALKEFEPELERIRVDTISKHKDGTPDIQRVRVIKGRG